MGAGTALCLSGLTVPLAWVRLERIFKESKETYYEALEHSSTGWHGNTHDSKPWINFYWGVIQRAYQEVEERAEHVTSGAVVSPKKFAAPCWRELCPSRAPNCNETA